MFKRYELHNHTTESDAGITCRELIDHMLADGVDCFAVTDHNTVSGQPIIKISDSGPVTQGSSSHTAAPVSAETALAAMSVYWGSVNSGGFPAPLTDVAVEFIHATLVRCGGTALVAAGPLPEHTCLVARRFQNFWQDGMRRVVRLLPHHSEVRVLPVLHRLAGSPVLTIAAHVGVT